MNNFNFDIAIELLRADGSITVNKSLIQAIGLNEAVLYCELLSRYNYFKTKEMLDEEGYFYNTQYDLQAGTGLGEKAQRTAINNLKRIGLIKVKLKGLPAKRHFKIIPNSELLAKLLKDGKEKAEKLANPTDTSVGGNLKRRKKELDTDQRSGNNIHYNNTNLNNTHSNNYLHNPLDCDGYCYLSEIDNEFVQSYLAIMRPYRPTHKRVKKENIDYILNAIELIRGSGFELPDWEQAVHEYFTQLPSSNDGDIIAFLSASMRYFNVDVNFELGR